MLKIALVEPYDHSEVLYDLCELLFGQQDIELCVFTQQYILDHAPKMIREGAGISWFTFEAKNRIAYFRQKRGCLNDCSLIIWITAVSPLGWINRLALTSPFVLVIHNRHTWFKPFRHLSLSSNSPFHFLADLARLGRLLLFEHPARQKMLRRISAVAFTTRNMLEYAVKAGHLPASGRAIFLPLLSSQNRVLGNSATNGAGIIRIVVPGTVTGSRRDYGLLVCAFEEAVPRFSRPAELVLLGRLDSGNQDLEKLRRLQGEFFRLITFESWVPQAIYDDHMQQADFLVLPYKLYRRFGIVREYLGKSANSGGINDMVRFGLPALCSNFYSLDVELEIWIERYTDHQALVALLITWVNDCKFQEVKNAINNSKGIYQKEKASSMLISQLNQIMKA
ncbi:MAG: glycosyltransferase [Phaeodactylibacter sp.]|nr:glycosyltransferase [Phaeodactylibacter sp.]